MSDGPVVSEGSDVSSDVSSGVGRRRWWVLFGVGAGVAVLVAGVGVWVLSGSGSGSSAGLSGDGVAVSGEEAVFVGGWKQGCEELANREGAFPMVTDPSWSYSVNWCMDLLDTQPAPSVFVEDAQSRGSDVKAAGFDAAVAAVYEAVTSGRVGQMAGGGPGPAVNPEDQNRPVPQPPSGE